MKRLKVLDLRHGVVTDDGAELLANSPDAKNLELIDLSYNTLTDAGAAVLKRAKIHYAARRQWRKTGDEYGDNEYLYAGDYE
jgi:Ran GTPase-activating protein (RanGAP) involved in mRNA processing and transport